MLAAQNFNRWSELDRQVGGGAFARDAGAEIFGLPADPEDRNDVGVVERFEPLSDAPIDPLCVISIANFPGRLRHRRDALEVAQRALGVFVERAKNCLLFVIGRNPVGALRRAQHAHGDAEYRDNYYDADRDEQTDTRVVPARAVRFPGGLYLRRRQHAATFGYFGPAQDSEQK